MPSFGMIAASVALACGLFFFIGYGIRYYIYVAVIAVAKIAGKETLAQGNGSNGQTASKNNQPMVEPLVSIHLPTYNEPNVVERLLTACTTLSYRNYEVVLIDDSTDNTLSVLHDWADANRISYTVASDTPEAPDIVTLTLASMQIPIKIIHRERRQGFKGGALNEALKYMNPDAEYVMIFDADFIPPPDIIRRFLAYFPQESPATVVGRIVDLDLRYGKGLLEFKEWVRERERVARKLRGNSAITEGSRLAMKALFKLDQLYATEAIAETVYTTRSKAIVAEMANIPLATERYADEPLALRRAFIVGQLFATEKIDEAEFHARIGAIFKPFEGSEASGGEGVPEVRQILELDNAYARNEVSEDQYAQDRGELVTKLSRQAASTVSPTQDPPGESVRGAAGMQNGTPNPNYVAVQGYQLHNLNQAENLMTAGIRAEFSGSYVVERPCEELFGLMKMISGSVYMIRADTLREYRWGESITEDWELTLRLYADGKKVKYTPTIAAPAECPSTLQRLIRQRQRWAEGHAFNVRKYFWKIMKSPNVTKKEKLEFLYFVPYYFQAFLFIVGTFSWLISEYTHSYLSFWPASFGWTLLFGNLFALPLMNLMGLLSEEAQKKDIAGVFTVVFLSYFMSFFIAKASIQGFLEKKEKAWVRTYKTGHITGTIQRFKPPSIPKPTSQNQAPRLVAQT